MTIFSTAVRGACMIPAKTGKGANAAKHLGGDRDRGGDRRAGGGGNGARHGADRRGR
jgi:hypothetical protein